MNQYEHSLMAMQRLLRAVKEPHWSKWIALDLKLWRQQRDVNHHLSAYGGMGTFNDIWILRENGYAVTRRQELWADTLFEWLKAVCRYLALHSKKTFTAQALAKAVGRDEPGLAAFIGGDKAPASMRGYAREPSELDGCCCLRCGYTETSRRSIDCFIAGAVIPWMVFQDCERLTLDKLVDQVLKVDIPGLASLRRKLADAVRASGIVLTAADRFMRPCTKCGDSDTAVYRWCPAKGSELRFKPAKNNLALRKKKPQGKNHQPGQTGT